MPQDSLTHTQLGIPDSTPPESALMRYAGWVWFCCSCISSKKVNPASWPHDLSTAGKFPSRRELERARYLRKGCLLCFAHRHAADAEESALLGCLGNVLADLTQPAFEGGSIARRLRINHSPSFAQGLDALRFDLGRFATGKLFQPAVRAARHVRPSCHCHRRRGSELHRRA